MAGPITWRTVNGPSLAEASRPLEAAQRAFDTAFTGLGGALKQWDAGQKDIWKQQDAAATQDVLGQIYRAKTVEEFNALRDSGALDQATAANGAVIDRAAVNALADGRPDTLQQRDLRGLKYGEERLGIEQAGATAEGLALAQKQDPVAINAWLAANPQNRRMAEVLGLNRTVQQSVEDQTFQRNQDTRAGNAEARAAEVQLITLAKLKDDLLNGPSARAAQAAQIAVANENILKSRADRANSEAQAAKALEVQRLGVALKGNMYEEGVYRDSNTVDLAKIMKDYDFASKNNDTGAIRSEVTSRLNKLARDGIKVKGPDGKEETIPIPLGAVKAALLASNGDYLFDGKYADTFEKELLKRVQGVQARPTPASMGQNSRLRLPLSDAPTRGAENPALNDWLDFQNITRSSAEVAPGSKKSK
jgi:hypothetical protein